MAEAWRIVKEKHAGTAFNGEGAAKNGGRWNSRGVRVVYTSATRSLAALETLVHLNPVMPFKYLAIPIKFDSSLVATFPLAELPVDWQLEPPPPSTKQIGDSWVRRAGSAILALPSVIISGELNYMLNITHPDFEKISFGKQEYFAFDPRLL